MGHFDHKFIKVLFVEVTVQFNQQTRDLLNLERRQIPNLNANTQGSAVCAPKLKVFTSVKNNP